MLHKTYHVRLWVDMQCSRHEANDARPLSTVHVHDAQVTDSTSPLTIAALARGSSRSSSITDSTARPCMPRSACHRPFDVRRHCSDLQAGL